MQRSRTMQLFAALGCAALLSSPSAAAAQTLLTAEDAAKSVAIENLNATATGVSGLVVNKTPHTVRSVDVIVQYHWLWNDEFKPGADSPGRTEVLRVPDELKPGQSAPFRHALMPGADRKDGRFSPEVSIGGFTIVVPAK